MTRGTVRGAEGDGLDTRTLDAATPFGFGHSLAAIRSFRPTRGEQRLDDDGSRYKAVRVLGRTVRVTVRAGSAANTLHVFLPPLDRGMFPEGRAERLGTAPNEASPLAILFG